MLGESAYSKQTYIHHDYDVVVVSADDMTFICCSWCRLVAARDAACAVCQCGWLSRTGQALVSSEESVEATSSGYAGGALAVQASPTLPSE